MGRAIVAGLTLGVVAAVLFVFHDSVQLSVSWPVILGFALWETVGRRGARGAMTALAGAIGVGFGYVTFAVVAEFLPITDLSFGIAVGVAVGILVMAGLMLRDRLPLAGLLVGYAAFMGVFEPRWIESPAAVRSHGIEDLTIALLGLLIGLLAATLVRAVADMASRREAERTEARARPGTAPGGMAMKGSAS